MHIEDNIDTIPRCTASDSGPGWTDKNVCFHHGEGCVPVTQWSANGRKSRALLPKCLQALIRCILECKTLRYREDTVIPHYPLMTDNLWHHGYKGKPLSSTKPTHSSHLFDYLQSCLEHECFFSNTIFGLSHLDTRAQFKIFLLKFHQICSSASEWQVLVLCGYIVWWLASVVHQHRQLKFGLILAAESVFFFFFTQLSPKRFILVSSLQRDVGCQLGRENQSVEDVTALTKTKYIARQDRRCAFWVCQERNLLGVIQGRPCRQPV